MSLASRSDRELLAAWREGDRAAADELIERHGAGLYGFFAGLVMHGVDVLCVRTFEAWRSAHDPEPPLGVRAELLAHGRRELLAWLREQGVDVEPGRDALARLEPGPTEAAAADRAQRRLLGALRRLPIDDQIGLELRHWEGLDDVQLAGVLESTPERVRARLARAGERLAAWLEAPTTPDDRTVEAGRTRDERSR